MYHTWCITCQEDDIKEMEKETDDKDELAKKVREMRLHKYLGESSRSGFDRGFEHLDALARLEEDSHLLRHLVNNHEGEDFSDVKFGMSVVKYMTTSFMRQIQEGVMRSQERVKHDILNSRTEYNRCALPRLTTRLGEKEMERWEEDMQEEKRKEDIMEMKIRMIRKKRNKARLAPARMRGEPAEKKQRLESGISIRSIWRSKQMMRKNDDEEETSPLHPSRKKFKKLEEEEEEDRREEKVTAAATEKEEEVVEEVGEKETAGEEENEDWDKRLENHQEIVEREAEEENEKEKRSQLREEPWELMDLCEEILEENDKGWERLKLKREEEERKKKRLEIARRKKREQNKEKEKEHKVVEKKAEETLERIRVILLEEREKVEERKKSEEEYK